MYICICIPIFTNRCFFDPFRIQNDSRIIRNIASTHLFSSQVKLKHQVFRAFAPQKKPGSLGNLHKKTTPAQAGMSSSKLQAEGVQKFIRGPKRQPRVLFHSKRVWKIFCFFPTLEMENFWAKTIGCTHGSSRWISGGEVLVE